MSEKIPLELKEQFYAEEAAAAIAPPAKKKRKRKAPEVVTGLPSEFAVTLTLPCRVVSESNERTHWGARAGRYKKQREILIYALRELGWYSILKDEFRWPFGFPAVVSFLHVGREFDDDNLRPAFKGLRDTIAHWAGIDDRDKRIAWEYDQTLGEPGVEIRIERKH